MNKARLMDIRAANVREPPGPDQNFGQEAEVFSERRTVRPSVTYRSHFRLDNRAAGELV